MRSKVTEAHLAFTDRVTDQQGRVLELLKVSVAPCVAHSHAVVVRSIPKRLQGSSLYTVNRTHTALPADCPKHWHTASKLCVHRPKYTYIFWPLLYGSLFLTCSMQSGTLLAFISKILSLNREIYELDESSYESVHSC